MTLSKRIGKSDFLGHCSFTQLFHDVEKFRRKPNIREGHRKTLVCPTYRINIWNIQPEAAKVLTLVRFLNVEIFVEPPLHTHLILQRKIKKNYNGFKKFPWVSLQERKKFYKENLKK